MNFGDVLVSLFYLLVFMWPFAFVFGFLWLVARYINKTWLAHIRRLLKEQGFQVRQIERLWFTTAFPGKTPPKRGEWIARVAVEDREGRLRSGWVRWTRLWPWDSAERWTVEWDEPPARGQSRPQPSISNW